MRFSSNLLLLLFLVVVYPLVAEVDIETEQANQREDIRLLQEKTGQLDIDFQTSLADVTKLKNDLAAASKEIARLSDLVKKLETAREQDRKAIIEAVSKELARELSKISGKGGGSKSASTEKPVKPKTEEGYEHVVEKGQTLAAIAEAYRVPVKTIMEANRLSKPDLKTGQKLFIPRKK